MAERTVLEHEPNVAEQFDDLAQQHEASTLGMWTFLATEVLLFGGLFVCYAVYRTAYFDAFHAAGKHMYLSLGSINTVILLGSSLTVALAVHAAEHGQSRTITRYLLITMALGVVFLGIKAMEYYLEYSHNLVPWFNWRFEGEHGKNARLFFVFYFAMTGLHAIHMTIGFGVLGVIARRAARGRYSAQYYNPVEMAGLYWHFVDIVWVFLFPTFYLVSLH